MDHLLKALRADLAADSLPPATEQSLAHAERITGLTLPPLLRRVYLQVSDGGFGPGYGAQSMPGGRPHGDWSGVVEAWQSLTSQKTIRFPRWLLPLTDWGCAIWTLVDCRDETGHVWGLDPNGGVESALFWTEQSVADWLMDSLRGQARQPDSTRRPRKTRRVWNMLGERSIPSL